MFNPFSFLTDKNAVSVDDVKNAVDQHKDVIILDVRTRDEYREGHITGSMHITLQHLEENLQKIPDKTKTYYVYCRSGSRSSHAVAILHHAGYSNVHNMNGGLLTWMGKGYSLVR